MVTRIGRVMCWLAGLAVLAAPAISRGQDQPETKTLAFDP